jgi:hypothetical protein
VSPSLQQIGEVDSAVMRFTTRLTVFTIGSVEVDSALAPKVLEPLYQSFNNQ